MLIEPIIGLKIGGNVVPETEFAKHSIFSTRKMLTDYFMNYGYQFFGFYEENSSYVIVKNNNRELEVMLGTPSIYRVIDYHTGNVIIGNLDPVSAYERKFSSDLKNVLSLLTHRVENSKERQQLIDNATDQVLVEADEIYFVSYDKAIYKIAGLEFVYELMTKDRYPLLNRDSVIYIGRDTENFVDMRYSIYRHFQRLTRRYPVDTVDLYMLMERFPFGKQVDNLFQLIDWPLKHGISVQSSQKSQIRWYDSLAERNQILEQINGEIIKVLDSPKVAQKKIDLS